MAMDSYIKGVAGDLGKQVVPVKPAERGQKAAAIESNAQQEASKREDAVKKVSEPGNTAKEASASKSSSNKAPKRSSAKKTSAPKSSVKKAPVPKSSAKKVSVPKSSAKKASVSAGSVPKADKLQVQKVDKAQETNNVQRAAETEQENMEVLFTMEKEPSRSTIDSAIATMNAQMSKTKCDYAYDEDTRRVTIRMYDDETGELIREVPPEKSLEAIKKVWEMAGIMVDEKF